VQKVTTSSGVVSSDIRSAKSTITSEEVLDEFLVIPQAANRAPMKHKKKGAINDRNCCSTDLKELKKKAQERKEANEKRALERQQKRNKRKRHCQMLTVV